MTEDRQTIIDKIAALKRKSEDTGCSEAEASIFASKVTELMEKYAVSMSELDEKPDHINKQFTIKYWGPWRRTLMKACCDACFTSLLEHRGEIITVVGRPLNIEATMEMYRFIEYQIPWIARSLYSDRKSQRRAETGLGIGVAAKIKASKLTDAESRLPVVQEKQAADDAMGEMFKFKMTKPRPIRYGREEIVGRMHSGRVQIRNEVES